MSGLDGALPRDSGSSQDVALAALTRRVAELEHRLNVMKIIVGLVLAGKALLVAILLYIAFGGGFVVRSDRSFHQTAQFSQQVERVTSGGYRRLGKLQGL